MSGRWAPAAALRVIAGLRTCCVGALDGPIYCTCWEPEFDIEQQELQEVVPAEATDVRAAMCADCAYRPDSPERNGDRRFQHAVSDDDPLGPLGIVAGDNPFWCHQGMRKPIRFRHRTLGIIVEAETDAYDPPIDAGVPYQADGTPALRCAGWTAHHEANLRVRLAHDQAERDAGETWALTGEMAEAIAELDA